MTKIPRPDPPEPGYLNGGPDRSRAWVIFAVVVAVAGGALAAWYLLYSLVAAACGGR
jgi:hypothetical protein